MGHVKFSVVLGVLHAAGWDVFDDSEAVLDYRAGRGREDFALVPSSPASLGHSTVLLVLIDVRPQGENVESNRTVRRIISQCSVAEALLVVLTDGRRWLLLFSSFVGNGDDHLFCIIDLTEDPDAAAENLNPQLSRERVASGLVARSA